MTIKVIKRGEPIAERRYKASCHGCKSVVEWLHGDAQRVYSGDQREGPFTQIYCPVCGQTMTGY